MSKLDKQKILHVYIVFILRINTIYIYTLIIGRVWKPKTAGEQEGGRVRLDPPPPPPGYAPALAAVIT